MTNASDAEARAIKCDRKEPCMNCTDARTECRRKRPRRKRQRDPRLSELERTAASVTQSQGSIPAFKAGTESDQHSTTSSGKQKEASAIDSPSVVGGQAVSGSVTPDALNHATSEAKVFLQRELESNKELSLDRYTVLESAHRLVDQISSTANLPRSDRHDGSELDVEPLAEFPPELCYMLTMGPTLENMCLALVRGQGDETTLNHYRVVVYTKAVLVVTRLPGTELGKRVHLQDLLRSSKRQYEATALAALANINLLTAPSLSLLQALLSGATLMQFRGDVSQCWTLTSFASRILVSLNYHTLNGLSPSSDTESQIHGAIFTCYHFDKLLSSLLLRPPSLPELKVKPADLVQLDPHTPLTAIMKAIVELAQIQEVTLSLALKPDLSDETYQRNTINALVQTMYNMHTEYQKQRVNPSFSHMEYEWLAVDFNYYTIMTATLRSTQTVRAPFVQKECLLYARKALRSLQLMQKNYFISGNFLEMSTTYLTWTVLLYPLTPFFVLFCNVVQTSDPDDYSLMSAITEALLCFVDTHPPTAKLYKLFSTFLHLCSPLIRNQHQMGSPQPHFNTSFPAMPSGIVSTTHPCQVSLEASIDPQHNIPTASNFDQIQVGESEGPMLDKVATGSAWNDDMFRDLFYSQPWLGWMESNI
ncbi:uncharacterized protein N7443_007562 [Penicillium atrosanguineum]|uniref:Xylanolytic transcriptional activator regulatory domain-containing protein n=1 Tax=Penicillium atrosanguineum TaxID=1132637 RepID=A0A9W9PLS7_9EURO|nr:uncharacterized protein N7443_007562 [Penicillium atrosanguineum]KAJ5118632.1 hypothetical protein N7526_010269 [Penicillium atrosanguineum]KAJ5296669.1 hypothetical protein N7443_007562 [Penicillium atrosanguineum]KAJ5299431.1 hypothetical protein N7476_010988 [Penicillium atrosanguineum]